MNPTHTIYRRELTPGIYEYADNDGHIFNAKSKVLYTHAVWFRARGNGHETFQLCRNETAANKASRARYDRIAVVELVDKNDAQRLHLRRVVIGRKLYAGMGWS